MDTRDNDELIHAHLYKSAYIYTHTRLLRFCVCVSTTRKPGRFYIISARWSSWWSLCGHKSKRASLYSERGDGHRLRGLTANDTTQFHTPFLINAARLLKRFNGYYTRLYKLHARGIKHKTPKNLIRWCWRCVVRVWYSRSAGRGDSWII